MMGSFNPLRQFSRRREGAKTRRRPRGWGRVFRLCIRNETADRFMIEIFLLPFFASSRLRVFVKKVTAGAERQAA